MKKKQNKKIRKRTRKNLHLRIVLTFAVLLLLVATGGLFILSNQSASKIASTSPRDSLQLDYFLPTNTTITPTTPPAQTPVVQPTTPIPTTGSLACVHESSGPVVPGCICNARLVACRNYKCVGLPRSSSDPMPPDPPTTAYPCGNGGGVYDRLCAVFAAGGNGIYCYEKPVIYLYPKKDTAVHVSVKTQGQVVVSNPLYPTNGWQVIAHPNGTINYQGKTYTELFYESASQTLNAPSRGIIIPMQNLEQQLREEITLLGLTKSNEQQEFLDWWVPRLQALHAPYILFSILDRTEKARVDNVEISPKPDTFTDFIAYFKPLSKIEDIEPLVITPAPTREGFTAIEWGGIIDNK